MNTTNSKKLYVFNDRVERLFIVSFTTVVLLAACSIFLVGCSSNSNTVSSDEGYTFTDDLGNEITLTSADRVVAGIGSFANCWELAGGTLVGASDDAFSDYEITTTNNSVGDFSSLNLESILALDPDFVILTAGTGGRGGDTSQAELRDALLDAGVPAACFKVTTFDDYKHLMQTFCEITHNSEAYKDNVEVVEKRIDDIVASVHVPGNSEQPTALVAITYSGGIRVQNEYSQTGSMLADFGVRNITEDNPSLLSDFQMEALLQENPDYIFLISMGQTEDDAQKNFDQLIQSNSSWNSLKAVQQGTCFVLPAEGFLYKPNAKWADSYEVLAKDLVSSLNQ